mmetsp:Transcript_130314/g.236885  ORF Transcript_130314/g.236885 Transcript_130314/m.236885 type:complete len:215 (+) Transcript_130314:511-1155(+)
MIHLEHTASANLAMMAPWGFVLLALVAPPHGIDMALFFPWLVSWCGRSVRATRECRAYASIIQKDTVSQQHKNEGNSQVQGRRKPISRQCHYQVRMTEKQHQQVQENDETRTNDSLHVCMPARVPIIFVMPVMPSPPCFARLLDSIGACAAAGSARMSRSTSTTRWRHVKQASLLRTGPVPCSRRKLEQERWCVQFLAIVRNHRPRILCTLLAV